MVSPRTDTTGAGAYTRLILGVYNLGVVRLSNSFIWRCPRHELLAAYRDNVAPTHLDVGPGTGWYLDRLAMPPTSITLVDLNPNSLEVSQKALARLAPTAIEADVLTPLDDVPPGFGSIGATHLFHCVPGDWSEKGIAFGHLADKLADDGVFFGATVLGTGVHHTPPARLVMRAYQRLGAFNNQGDSRDGLEAELRKYFEDVVVRCVGSVALFEARTPRRTN
ncbi:class I SAM-dependent methyltransferase [Rhodococcus aerolatus]